jgi:hypothetical protein
MYRYSGARATCRSLLAKAHLKKNLESKKLDGYRWGIKFPIAVFLRGELFKILTFWGLAGVRFLFYLNFIWKYLHVHLQKKHTSEHPLLHQILIKFRSRTDL